jgi:hypothetical protein
VLYSGCQESKDYRAKTFILVLYTLMLYFSSRSILVQVKGGRACMLIEREAQ